MYLKRFQPNSRAKYVAFKTLLDPAQMPGQRSNVLDWPYVEGLRIDEAMHPLTSSRRRPLWRGAAEPEWRAACGWSCRGSTASRAIKSIVEIHFSEHQPVTSWSIAYPDAYGFFANVNPAVDHPNWSQARERRIGSGVFAEKIPTQPFNGYANEVADLYRGLDLRRYY